MQHPRIPRRALPAMYRIGFRIRGRFPRWHCYDSLRRDHVPLYAEDVQLAVLFSPKAGCTFAVKWFFFQAGILEEALAYSPWPHEYRLQVLYKQPGYIDKVTAVPSLGPRAVKFVRNPYDRAVSGYLHFAHLSQRPGAVQARSVIDAIGEHLGRAVDDGSSFSFREFVSYLAAVDLDTANPHFRRQVSPCERVGRLPHMRVVKIEDSKREIPELEAELGLPASDYDELRRSPHHTLRSDQPGFFGDKAFTDNRKVAVPSTSAFYDEALISEVGRLYAEDCEAYGYAPPTPTPADG